MATNKHFEKLLEPSYIGHVKTRNRMIKPGAAMLYPEDGALFLNGQVKSFYEAIAKGGIGLIIVESPIIDYPMGARWRKRFRMDDDKYIQGMSELTQIIHKYGCPTFMQMNHDGPWQTQHWETEPDIPPLVTGQPVAASAVSLKAANDFHNEVPRELTLAEIQELVDKFASAAVRAQKAGFDGVDLNAASSHLLHNFLSPFWNRRQDIYGGTLENRARFVTEIIREIKKRLGNDFPVCVTINGVEVGKILGLEHDQFVTSEISVGTAKLLQSAGADAIQVRSQWLGYHISGFFPEALFYPEPPIPLNAFPQNYDGSRKGAGAHVPLAAAIRKSVTIPVIAVGRLNPELGEQFLREGKVDFIGLNRRLYADPELPNKIAAGRLEDIAPCTACHTCIEPVENKRCRINAFLGSNKSYNLTPAERKKRVLVIGGGPAGMEAARVAALRGHQVTLYEKSNKLGGLLPVAALVKGTDIEDLPAIVRYFETQLNKLGIDIKKDTEVKASTIEEIKPDVVILATGGIPSIPNIPGIDRSNVISSVELHQKLKFYLRFLSPGTLRWLTRFWVPVGKRVVIIGGGKHGCELAEFLVKRGRKVTIIDSAEMLGEGLFYHLRWALFTWFETRDVELIAGARNIQVTAKGLQFTTREGVARTVEVDSVIPAMALASDSRLAISLNGKVPEIYTVGDCREPRYIVDAIADGFRIAQSI